MIEITTEYCYNFCCVIITRSERSVWSVMQTGLLIHADDTAHTPDVHVLCVEWLEAIQLEAELQNAL